MLTILALILAQPAGQQAEPPQPAKPKLICRADDQMVGTRIHSGRRCKTAEQWQEEDARQNQMPTTLRIMPNDGSALQPPERPQI
jgi:hypothetical protein